MKEQLLARLPERFRQNILDLHGARGAQWIARLPNLIAEIAEIWSLSVEEFYPNLSYHFVATCLCAGGRKAVLKIGVHEPHSIVFSEAKMLGVLCGKGAVQLLRFDKERCALLLERLTPGEDLIALCREDDDRATAIAIDVMGKIWRIPEKINDFPDLKNGLRVSTKPKTQLLAKAIFKKHKIFSTNLLIHRRRGFCTAICITKTFCQPRVSRFWRLIRKALSATSVLKSLFF
jgi:hypothetical protein